MEFTFSIGAEGDVTVRSYRDLKNWLQKESARWAWMTPGHAQLDRHGIASELNQAWINLIHQVNSHEAQGLELETLRPFLYPLATGFMMVSTTTNGATVLEIRESAGDVAAMAAFGFLKQRLNASHLTTEKEFLGMILSVLPNLTESSDWADRLKRERSTFRMSTRSLIEKVNKDAEEREISAARNLDRLRGISLRIFRLRRNAWREAQQSWEASATDAVALIDKQAKDSLLSIQNAEASYREFMRLKAPVEYWEKKAEGHKTKENEARTRLYFFFPITLVILSVVFLLAGNFLINHPETGNSKSPIALYVVVSGGLLLLSTIAFWIGRLLTKLYLSEHHLRNDAEERATMTTTYLALTADNAAGEADRQIVLSALFRATPDGIVKEDGPGDIGLQGLLAKLIAK